MSETDSSKGASFRYWAFISYSHADDATARWLHRAIERFRVPKHLVGRPHIYGTVPDRVRPVFRDRDEFATSSHLDAEVSGALTGSRDLIVLCSARAATSMYVNEEIRQFRLLGRTERIHCLIVDSDAAAGPEDYFPPALTEACEELGEDARPTPIAADARRDRDGKHNALLKVLAGMLDVPYDELRQRDRRRRRERRSFATFALAVGLCLGFVGLADAGIGLPGAEWVRLRLDRADFTLFRPVPDHDQIDQVATSMRGRLHAFLLSRRDPNALYHYSADSSTNVDAWSSAQAVAALARAPESTSADWAHLGPTIEQLFLSPMLAYEQDSATGWIVRAGRPPNGNVAAWVLSALATTIGRDDMVPASARAQLEDHYRTALSVAARLAPIADGGWNMLANQDNPENHNTYTTALGFQAMLDAWDAGIEWIPDETLPDAVVRTAEWLLESYDTDGPESGWRRFPGDNDDIYDGLTLQIFGLLMRAEERGAIALSEQLVEDITDKLIALVDYTLEHEDNAAEFTSSVSGVDENESVYLLWYPWAIPAVDVWLRRASRSGAAPEDVRRVRRSLGHLITGLGEDLVTNNETAHTFRGAELMWTLSGLGPPSRATSLNDSR